MENALYLLNDLCRLCLEVPGTHNIFENDNVIQDIFLCTGIMQISCHDKLPKRICTDCMNKIATAKDLQEYATKNDTYMRSFLFDNGVVHKIAKPRIVISITSLEPIQEVVGSAKENEVTASNIQIGGDDEVQSTVIQSLSVERKEISNNSNQNDKNSVSQINHQSYAKRKHKKLNQNDKNNKHIIHQNNFSTENIHSSSIMRRSPSPKSTSVTTDEGSGETNSLKCDICEKVYTTQKKLYLHQRLHSKNLHCPFDACGKRFATKGDLQKHVRSHTGEKPYKCNLCEKSFTQNVTLKSHREAIHHVKLEVI